MASEPLLHIKDSYYFDVPRKFWRVSYDSSEQIADRVGDWAVRNDADYQDWETDKFIEELKGIVGDSSAIAHAKQAWLDWQHADSHRHGRPFDQYVQDALVDLGTKADEWAKTQSDPLGDTSQAYLAEFPDSQLQWMHSLKNNADQQKDWLDARRDMDDRQILDAYIDSPRGEWSELKLRDYNQHLSGKVFIPQPFATLRNAYEPQSGLGISRYMVIEVVVAIIIFLLFRWLAGKIADGSAPKGKIANLLESFVVFIRTDIVEKGIDPKESHRFMPLMWTIFFFILGCNLMGMLPWVGSPTAAFGLTVVLALLIFAIGTYLGISKFGFVGYLKSLSPELGLPIYLAVFIVPMVWVIEFISVFIKHGILALRLFANMVAGHLTLLGVLGLAFSVNAADMGSVSWTALGIVSIIGTTILSFMELFVAFLQAYVFTLLAALFIGSATHGH